MGEGISIIKDRSISLFLITLIPGFTFYNNAAAFTMPAWYTEKAWHPVISIDMGTATSSDIGQSASFPSSNSSTSEFYNYSANEPTQTSGLLEGFIGGEVNLQPNWAIQAGLDYTQPAPFFARGNLTQGADVSSENHYIYHYSILTRQLLAEGKLFYVYKEHYRPYLLLGMGAAFNKAYDYYTNASPYLTFTRMYANQTSTSFSYSVGLGIDFDITKQIRLGVGYRFANLGKIELGNATIDNVNVAGTLSRSNTYINEVLGQITWVFC